MKTKYQLAVALKGLIVGGTMLVPGVSGGSMAMILGVYDRLVSSVSSFFKNKTQNFLFLLTFALGGGLGMLLFANPLYRLIEAYPMPMLYFFLGAVAGGVPLIYRQTKTETFTWKIPVYIIIGAAIVLLFSLLPEGLLQPQQTMGIGNYLLLTAAGIIAAVALVLPGISVSYLLLMMGIYDMIMEAISHFYLPTLISLGIGLIAGILLTTRILETAMNRHPQPTYCIILGFVLCSMAEVFPGIPSLPQFPICVVTLAAGFGIIRFLSGKEAEAS